MVNLRTHPYISWECSSCGKRRLWRTAWGMQPRLKCGCEWDVEPMEFESAVPLGSAWIQEEA